MLEWAQSNPFFKMYGEKMIIGKSNADQTNFDCLIFCARDVKNVIIPDFIEHICSCAFDNCEQINKIEFSPDSKLKTIGTY